MESIFCHYLQEKRLDREALIFVSENFQFDAEAVHTTAKLDRRYSALVVGKRVGYASITTA